MQPVQLQIHKIRAFQLHVAWKHSAVHACSHLLVSLAVEELPAGQNRAGSAD